MVLLLSQAHAATIGVKLIKSDRNAPPRPFTIELPSDCHGCTTPEGPVYLGQNPRELFFHVRAEPGLVRGIRVRTGGIAVREVIVEKKRLPFSREAGAVVFDLPVLATTRSSTMEVQTHLNWPGMTLRVEHAFRDRRAGKYATGPWPAVQLQSALNLEFGLREAIHALGLDTEVEQQGLGRIHLMGFDTNSPLGHEDYPPHIHLILRWPHFAGSQAPHFYITERGLLDGTTVTIDGMPQIAPTKVPNGQSLPAVDYLGNTLYETLVTGDGALVLRRPDGRGCDLKPGAGGVRVACSGREPVTVRATDDTDRGEMRVFVGSQPPEVYRYDVDTAELIQ